MILFVGLIGAAFSEQPMETRAPNSGSKLSDKDPMPFSELKKTGFERSRYRDFDPVEANTRGENPPDPNLLEFTEVVRPLLNQHCVDCHGPDTMEGNIRLDTLDPNLLQGKDTDWWMEVFAVVTKAEMPPPEDSELDEQQRQKIVNWLSEELHSASIIKRNSGVHTTLRRLTRYEYNYALQDLLGLPWNFAKDLPPDPRSEEGFENSSELLHLSVSQFETYHRLAREALRRATVRGERPPVVQWGISMRQAAQREWKTQDDRIAKLETDLIDDQEKLRFEIDKLHDEFRKPHRTAHYKQLSTGRTAPAQWAYYGAKYAFAPVDALPEFSQSGDCVAILPPSRNPKLVVELGNQLPDEGTMRVTVRASRANPDNPVTPSLQLMFGWQASNEGRALLNLGNKDVPVTGTKDKPQTVQWDVPLGEIYPRNTVRKTSTMGAMPSPSEYIRLANTAASPADIQIDYVTVQAPIYPQWPPRSHRQLFPERQPNINESDYAKQVIQRFMNRAWRREVSSEDLDRKMLLYDAMRAQSDTLEEAVLEVLATVLSSPQFLFVGWPDPTSAAEANPTVDHRTSPATSESLATRLALFLWCSLPDDELLGLAKTNALADETVLEAQVERMLDDPRSQRFAKHFVHQWLKMELLEFVNLKQLVPGFDPLLKDAMQQEPVEFFADILKNDASVLDFLHADYAVVNERLAKHYGWQNIQGNHFQKVQLRDEAIRGGLLTQAGFLAMNSDWPDSHPLKRAIWLLECLLDDPPPPPPPAVPQIDLADPRIAEMTLKERIEDHRNQAACRSCHVKIDPWGIAFENFDALGRWRDQIKGQPVDASSELYNHETLNGVEGLKRFLLERRQDQFVHAMVSKMATYALGRSPGFEGRAELDEMTAKVRAQGDGLKTIIFELVRSELFQSK